MIDFTLTINPNAARGKKWGIMLLSCHGGYLVDDEIGTKKEALKRRSALRRRFKERGAMQGMNILRTILSAAEVSAR